MKVGIIVISFNHYLFTKFCIDSIINSTSKDLYKLCLVDNGSIDYTKTWAEKLLSDNTLDNFISNSRNFGACKASNQGVEWCLQQEDLTHILVMANDHIVTPGWLEAMLDADAACINPFVFHSVKEIRGLCPEIGVLIDKYKKLRLKYLQEDNEEDMNYVLNITYGGSLNKFANLITSKHKFSPLVKTNFILWPGLIMYRREVIDKVGLKDEEFLKFDLASYADIDYYVRVYKAGFTCGLTKAAYVHHWGSITTRKSGLSQENKIGYNNNEKEAYLYFIKKWRCNPHNLLPLVNSEKYK
ncbi:MAG: glycosyltransferase [Campylobacterota bacterium]|nr:glycosyltransferase [Campylobacterota bacterium]